MPLLGAQVLVQSLSMRALRFTLNPNPKAMYITDDAPPEIRQMVDAFAVTLAELRAESDRINRNPRAFTEEYKSDVLSRFKSVAVDLQLIEIRCRKLGLEWVEWPDVIM